MELCVSCGIQNPPYVACFVCRCKVCSECRAGGVTCTECAETEKFLSYDRPYIHTATRIVEYCKTCFSDADYIDIKRFKELLVAGSITRSEKIKDSLKLRLTDDGLYVLEILEKICCGLEKVFDTTIDRKCSK
jgi:hypothetical protein